MVISSDCEWGKKRICWVRNMGEYAAMPSELEGEKNVEVMEVAGLLDIGH